MRLYLNNPIGPIGGGRPRSRAHFNPSELIDAAESMPTQAADLRRKLRKLNLDGVKVLLYSELSSYNTLEQFMGKDGVIILVRQVPDFGHWIALTYDREPGAINYFDSYGFGIDELLRDLTPEMARRLGQEEYLLSMFIDEAAERGVISRVNVNKVELQAPTSSVAVCGGYAVLRIYWRHINNEEFVEFISDPVGTGSDSDRNVALLTALL
jgi:hypothetical protein